MSGQQRHRLTPRHPGPRDRGGGGLELLCSGGSPSLHARQLLAAELMLLERGVHLRRGAGEPLGGGVEVGLVLGRGVLAMSVIRRAAHRAGLAVDQLRTQRSGHVCLLQRFQALLRLRLRRTQLAAPLQGTFHLLLVRRYVIGRGGVGFPSGFQLAVSPLDLVVGPLQSRYMRLRRLPRRPLFLVE